MKKQKPKYKEKSIVCNSPWKFQRRRVANTKRNNGKKPAAAYWTKKGIEYWLEDTFSPGTIFTSEDIVEKLGEVVLDEGAMNTILKQLHRDGVLDEVRDETYKLL